jgi:hypothetical protein
MGVSVFDGLQAEFLSISQFLKATPFMEGDNRFLYFEAANEARDFQNEVVLAKALAESAEYYLRYGNVDLDHITLTGAKKGIPDYNLFEVGRPVDVKLDSTRTFVKSQIYRGDGPVAEKANHLWASVTDLSPPARWYPSVAGQIIERGGPPGTPEHSIIKKVRWINVGLSRTPVNPEVSTVSTIPMDVFAKCWGAGGIDMAKAESGAVGLTAGYGTDDAALTGGAALRTESLDHGVQSYWDFRDRAAGDILNKSCPQTAEGITAHAASKYGVSKSQAAEWTARFMADLRGPSSKRKV